MQTQLLRYGVYFISAVLLSTASVPLVIRLSRRYGLMDIPNERKIHKKLISRIGGLSLFLAFIIPFGVLVVFQRDLFGIPFRLGCYIAAMLLSFTVGFVDDLVPIRARYKLVCQVCTAFIATLSGLTIEKFVFFNFFQIKFGYFSYVLTIAWIVAFMNAINLIDGMDGLASGIVAISSIFLFVIGLLMQNILVSFLSIILLGSVIGFYIFNYPPAKIFMGDGGAYFLGFMYSTIGLMGIKKTSIAVLFIVPIVLMLIPIFDAVMVTLRRMKCKKNIFVADKTHIHHRLLQLGFSEKHVLFIFYFLVVILGIFSVLIILLPPQYSFSVFVLIFLVTFFSFYLIYIFEKQVERIKNGNDEKGPSNTG
jgi:UDP-GlcNAc:undecaprenyl-phosphate GlcNAc-1-phosphate transferase